MSGKIASIDGLDLQGSTYHTTQTDALNAPPRNVDVVNIARADYGVQVFESWGSRTINHEGWLQGTDRDNTDEAIDGLKRILGRRDAEYRIGHAGGFRQWIGTPRNIAISQNATDTTRAGYSFEMVCPYPFATDGQTATLVSESAVTDAATSFSLSAGGTYFAIPVIIITINSINPDDSEVSITLGNPLADRYLTINGTFLAGDELTIDCVNGTVFQNTTLLDVDGQFPIWSPQAGSFEYSDTATTRNIDIEATYERRFL